MKDWNILLLEAGTDEVLAAQIPILASYLQSTEYDWQYRAEAKENACQGILYKYLSFWHTYLQSVTFGVLQPEGTICST